MTQANVCNGNSTSIIVVGDGYAGTQHGMMGARARAVCQAKIEPGMPVGIYIMLLAAEGDDATRILKVLLVCALFMLGLVAVFASQLYNPTVLWVVSYVIFAGSVGVGFVAKGWVFHLILSLLLSMCININILFQMLYGDFLSVLAYGVLRVVVIGGIMFLIARLVASLLARRAARADGSSGSATG